MVICIQLYTALTLNLIPQVNDNYLLSPIYILAILGRFIIVLKTLIFHYYFPIVSDIYCLFIPYENSNETVVFFLHRGGGLCVSSVWFSYQHKLLLCNSKKPRKSMQIRHKPQFAHKSQILKTQRKTL